MFVTEHDSSEKIKMTIREIDKKVSNGFYSAIGDFVRGYAREQAITTAGNFGSDISNYIKGERSIKENMPYRVGVVLGALQDYLICGTVFLCSETPPEFISNLFRTKMIGQAAGALYYAGKVVGKISVERELENKLEKTVSGGGTGSK